MAEVSGNLVYDLDFRCCVQLWVAYIWIYQVLRNDKAYCSGT